MSISRSALVLTTLAASIAACSAGGNTRRHESVASSASHLAVVTSGAFTNVYVYPDPDKESWEDHIKGLRSDSAQFSRAAIDAVTDRMMAPGWPSYADSLYQYSGINPPQFFGSSVASQACVDAAMNDRNNGVMEMGTLRTLSNCHLAGMDPSPQLNLILSPDIPVGNLSYTDPNAPDMCSLPGGHPLAWHTGGLNSPNFSAVPTRQGCASDFNAFTNNLSHEVVEILSDPGWMGLGGGSLGADDEIGDTCVTSGDKHTIWAGDDLARYWSNADGNCQPRLDPPSGSTQATWILGAGSPLAHFDDQTSVTLGVPAGRVTTDAGATQVSIVIQTGDDDLQAYNAAQVTLNTAAGNVVTTNINNSGHWNNGETNSAILALPAGVRVSDIQGVTITSDFHRVDNWNVNKVALVVSFPAGSALTSPIPPPVRSWVNASEAPLIRFTGHVHDLPLPVSSTDPKHPVDVGHPIQSLDLVLWTGNDDLRGGSNAGDNCDVAIVLASGTTISLPNVNGGQTWGGWTKNTISVPLPAGFKGGDVTAVKLHTGFSGNDNWNLERVQLRATVLPLPPPTVGFVFPSVGDSAGGTPIRIDGANFEVDGNIGGSTRIVIGNADAGSVSCATPTSCTAIAPPGSGVQPITVIVDGVPVTASTSFYYSPSIVSLSENSGVAGDSVMISGIGIGGATAISFGPHPVKTFTCWNQPSQCRVVVPGGTGRVDVRVTVGSETTPVTAADSFAFGAPIITGLVPAGGPMAGDTDVVIEGRGFDTTPGNVQVFFGSIPSPRVDCSASTWCTAETPPAAQLGAVDVTLTSLGVATARTAADLFTYSPYPKIVSFVYYGTGDIALDGAAPPTGAPITITCSDPTILPPTTVTVPPGQLSLGNFILPLLPVTTAETVTLTASNEVSSATVTIAQSQTPSCTCSGTGIHGPVTVACGQTTIGTDGKTYLCNAPGGTNDWALCQCTGTGISGPVTVACGQSTVGTDGKTYVCNAPGGTNHWAPCQCTGTQVSGPVACGQSAVGTNGGTFVCNAPGGPNGFSPCECTGTGINGAVTVACGKTTCGTDKNTYVCNAPGGTGSWALQSSGCACVPRACDDTVCGTVQDGCGGTISCGVCPKQCSTPQSCCVQAGGQWVKGGCVF